MTSPTAEQWSAVWRLYAEQQSVFASVFGSLRSRGLFIAEDQARDLVHDFIVERAPAALEAFRPERGELAAWLFVVFKRFVQGEVRDSTRRRQLVTHFRRDLEPAPTTDTELEADVTALRHGIASLPVDQRAAMEVYLSSDLASERDVARVLATTRWRARQLLRSAFLALGEKLVAVDSGHATETISHASATTSTKE